jgi:hypothetical protein
LSGTVALGALRGSFGGSGAAGQARLISGQLGPASSGPSGAQAPGTGVRQAAAPAPATSFPPGASGSAGAAAASAGARTGAVPGAAAGAAPAAAGGPAGLAVAGLAAGAATARRKATEAMQPPAAGGGQ